MNSKRKVFFSSDHHFGHQNIMKYEAVKRVDSFGNPFADVDAMDSYLIDRWNETVGENDLVYYLGDFSFKLSLMREVLCRLNGDLILVMGNHDPKFREVHEGRGMPVISGFESIHKELVIKVEEIGKVKLAHFPYAYSSEFPGQMSTEKGDEALLLHGHVHGKWKVKKEADSPLMINVSVEEWGLAPVSLEEIVRLYRENS